MFLPNNNSNTKPNKYCDVNNTKLSELVDLIKDFLSVNLYKISRDKKINNVILEQSEHRDSIIVVKLGYFQNNKKILCLIQDLSRVEIEIALRLALEKSFNCNLSKRKIVFVQKYTLSTDNME